MDLDEVDWKEINKLDEIAEKNPHPQTMFISHI